MGKFQLDAKAQAAADKYHDKQQGQRPDAATKIAALRAAHAKKGNHHGKNA